MTVELSAFYFDIRKDALYCDAPSSEKRKAALAGGVACCSIIWSNGWRRCCRSPWKRRGLSAIRMPNRCISSSSPGMTAEWQTMRSGGQMAENPQGAPCRHRCAGNRAPRKAIGSSLESAPKVFVTDPDLFAALEGLDFAEICITSQIEVTGEAPPAGAFTIEDVSGVAVLHQPAQGRKCARSWRVLPEVGSDPDYPDLSLRDAAAMREIDGKAV